jgi:hypothetical protein
MLPLLLTPSLDVMDSAHSRYQAELGAMATLIAAERHRRRTGDWPASIDAIDSACLSHAPVDPFSGKSYRVRRRDGQFVVHSIGANLRDELGEYVPKQWSKGVTDDVGASAWDVRLRRQPARQ